MKRIAWATLAIFASAGIAIADPLEGTWQTAQDDNGNFGHIEVAPCGDAYCGVLVKSFRSDGSTFDSPNNGKQIIWDMQALGGGKYGRGKVWSPDRDQVYSSRMVLEGDTVTVKGCVLVVCRDGGTWTRVQ